MIALPFISLFASSLGPTGAEPRTILQRIADGDPTAVEQCMDTYGGLLWSMARKKGLDPEDADDLVQEIFIELWKSAERYDPSQASETTFVAMIGKRRLIDRFRRKQRRPVTQTIVPDLHDEADGEHQQLEARVELSVAQKALGVLRPDERSVVLMSAYHGMSHGQISKSTGLPLGTVKTYIRRGLMRVKEALEESDRTQPGGRLSAEADRSG
ncbi:MAG: sigma-70 family RNA polymerase sigma factor [Thermoanaerobaculia bacterium]|nr:sigma-70 family RNA polymerase sigma factor [Thermoanaerobaculia bacterium]